jgi:hypothetical protein
VIGVKSWQKPRKNCGIQKSSSGRLNAVNPAVALSAPKYQVPQWIFELATIWLTAHRPFPEISGQKPQSLWQI